MMIMVMMIMMMKMFCAFTSNKLPTHSCDPCWHSKSQLKITKMLSSRRIVETIVIR